MDTFVKFGECNVPVIVPSMTTCIHNEAPFGTSPKLAKFLVDLMCMCLEPLKKHDRALRPLCDDKETYQNVVKFCFSNKNGYCNQCCWNIIVLSNKFSLFEFGFYKLIDDWLFDSIALNVWQGSVVFLILSVFSQILLLYPRSFKIIFNEQRVKLCVSWVKASILHINKLGILRSLIDHMKQFNHSDQQMEQQLTHGLIISKRIIQIFNRHIYFFVQRCGNKISLSQLTSQSMNSSNKTNNNLYASEVRSTINVINQLFGNRYSIPFQILELLQSDNNKCALCQPYRCAQKTSHITMIKLVKPYIMNGQSDDNHKLFTSFASSEMIEYIKFYKIHYQQSKQISVIWSKKQEKCVNFQCGKTRSKSRKLFACGQCRIAKYCSRKCQKMHWKYQHSRECLNLSLY